MAKLQYRSLSMRTVNGLSGDGKDIIFWDRELQGFGGDGSIPPGPRYILSKVEGRAGRSASPWGAMA